MVPLTKHTFLHDIVWQWVPLNTTGTVQRLFNLVSRSAISRYIKRLLPLCIFVHTANFYTYKSKFKRRLKITPFKYAQEQN